MTPRKTRRKASRTIWEHRRDRDFLVWDDLCAVASKLGIEVREEPFAEDTRSKGGLVRIGEKVMFIVDAGLPVSQRTLLLARELRNRDTEAVSMQPYLRKIITGEG